MLAGIIRRDVTGNNENQLWVLLPSSLAGSAAWAMWVPAMPTLSSSLQSQSFLPGCPYPGLTPCWTRSRWDTAKASPEPFVNGDTCGVSVRKWPINHWNIFPKQIYQRSRKCMCCPLCQTPFSCSQSQADGWGDISLASWQFKTAQQTVFIIGTQDEQMTWFIRIERCHPQE